MKFSELEYTRPDVTRACREFFECASRIAAAKSAAGQLEEFRAYEARLMELETMLGLGQLRYFLNTADGFYKDEMAYIGSVSPELELAEKAVSEALLASPFRSELEAELGDHFFKTIAVNCANINEASAKLMAEEQELSQRYETLASQGTVTFEGKEYPLSAMSPFYSDEDRARRRAANRTVNAWYEAHGAELDEIFDKLVKNRTEQAKLLGYDSYTDMKYASRRGYGRKEITAFREQVLSALTPLLCEIKEAQRVRLGLDTFRIYDSALRFKDGNPQLAVKGEAFVDTIEKLFGAMSPETGEYFSLLKKSDMLDLFDRPNKISYAAFCLELPSLDMDFICGHFNGEEFDLECFVHEFGHAFASRRASGLKWYSLRGAGNDISETHSNTMELITAPYHGLFFSPEDAKKYKRKQLEYAIYFISSICLGDEFQHEVYDRPDMTPAERNQTYADIYKKYNPYLDLSDTPFDSWGAMWQDALVIYTMPFYMIDYALAQTLALSFYMESLKDFDSAWKRYLSFLDLGGTLSFTGAVKACGLPSPFAPDSLAGILAFIREELKK